MYVHKNMKYNLICSGFFSRVKNEGINMQNQLWSIFLTENAREKKNS